MTGSVAGLDLRQVLDALGQSVVVVANVRDRPIVYVNAAFEETTGWSAASALGQNCRVLQGSADNAQARAHFAELLAEGRPGAAVFRNERPDGTLYWNEVVLSPIWSGSVITHYVGVQRDVTGRVEAQERARWLSEHDPLTGLSNRRHLERWLRRTSSEPERPAALIYMDIDAFKTVNDELGHEAGDELLRQVASRLEGIVRPTDLLARIGGDEFVVGLTGPVDAAGVVEAAERILRTIRAPFALAGGDRTVTASIGLAAAADAESALLDAGDAAMYRVKHSGGDGWALARPATEPAT